jgi:hypothetical protein
MTYVHIHNWDHPFKTNFCHHTTCNNLAVHPCLLITDILIRQIRWQAIKFYNNISDKMVLSTLVSLDLDSTIPTIIMGDFNLHSNSWSPHGWSNSSTAVHLEEWLAMQTFSLLSQSGIPMHRGKNRVQDSTINLVWCNYAATIQGTFQGAHIDWNGSLGSDHALICTITTTLICLARHREDCTNCFDMSISPKEWEEWECIFALAVPPNPLPIQSKAYIDSLIDNIYNAFNTACTATMKKKGNVPAFSSKWWNNNCRTAAVALLDATNLDNHKWLNKELKQTVRIAKCDWANMYIMEANIWEVAAWQHGRCSSHIPALIDHDSNLSYNHEVMASLLSECFFASDNRDIPATFPDDPPLHVTCPFPPFNKEEILDLLKQMASKSAPGILGIGWDLLK